MSRAPQNPRGWSFRGARRRLGVPAEWILHRTGSAQNEIVLEVEAGVVGGEEDGAAGTEDMPEESLYTTPEDMVSIYEALHEIGRFTFAATFGNVHGHYKPGAVKLRPEILKQGQAAVVEKYGAEAEMDLVFHGGSGSLLEEIRETLAYGVIKMNVDTDTQYAFTRPIAGYMMTNYEGVLKIDGEIGIKKQYDPRAYLKAGEQAMSESVCVAWQTCAPRDKRSSVKSESYCCRTPYGI